MTTISDDTLARIERSVLRTGQQIDSMNGKLEALADGLSILASRIDDIHTACCGPQPPSELGLVLRDLTSAVTRTGDLVQALIERLPPRPH